MEPVDIGMELARKEFARRGNHAEAHLSEAELAALISIGAERAQEQAHARIVELQAQAQTARDDLRERVENEVERAYGLDGSAAPVREMVRVMRGFVADYATLAAEFQTDTGLTAPGRDVAASALSAETREKCQREWVKWMAQRAHRQYQDALAVLEKFGGRS